MKRNSELCNQNQRANIPVLRKTTARHQTLQKLSLSYQIFFSLLLLRIFQIFFKDNQTFEIKTLSKLIQHKRTENRQMSDSKVNGYFRETEV